MRGELEWLRDSRLRSGVVFLCGTFLFLCVASIIYKSPTYDEYYHLRYGKNYLAGDTERREGIDDSKMPVSALNAMPSFLVNRYIRSSPFKDLMNTLLAARLVTIFFGGVCGVALFIFARSLYGNQGGFFALFLYAFAPNLIAHSRLVTTDLYLSLAIILSLYTFRLFLLNPSSKSCLLSAFILGASQLVKFSAVFLYPIFLLIAALRLFYKRKAAYRYGWKRVCARGVVYLALFAVINLLVINGGFFFHGSLRPLGSYYFRSKLFREIQRVLPPKLPVPLPKDYVEGLDYVRFREQTALGFGNMYLLGEIHENKGFPGYFFYALLFKLPLPVIVLFLWALWEYLFGRRRKAFLRDEIFLLIPIAFWLIYFNYFNNSHIGIRYVLPTIPLIHIFCGSIFAKDFISKRRVWAGALLGVWLIASVLSYFPHYIPYFNEIVWDRKFAYRYLSDSNIDWGQGRYYARDYLKAHPDIIFEPPIHTKGKILVGVNALTGVWIFGAKSKREMADRYRWLREGHSPIGHVAYSYLLFDVP